MTMVSSIVAVAAAVLWLAFVLPGAAGSRDEAQSTLRGEEIPRVEFPWWTTHSAIMGFAVSTGVCLAGLPTTLVLASQGVFSVFWMLVPAVAALVLGSAWRLGSLQRHILLRRLDNIDADLDEFAAAEGAMVAGEGVYDEVYDVFADEARHAAGDASADELAPTQSSPVSEPAPGTWTPRPVPAPLYTLKAVAPGPVSPVVPRRAQTARDHDERPARRRRAS